METLKDHVITEHAILRLIGDCKNEVRDTDERGLADLAESEGCVILGDETFCAEHADDEGDE